MFRKGQLVEKFEVGVVGVGYVGLVTGACLAHLGHRVTCVDKDKEKVRTLEHGRIPIYEPHLEEMVSQGVEEECLSFTTELSGVIAEADVVFIAVDTPQDEDGSADLSSVAVVARGIGRAIAESRRQTPLVVVNKSTVPVGSGDYVSMLVRDGASEGGNGGAGLPGRLQPGVFAGRKRRLRLVVSG